MGLACTQRERQMHVLDMADSPTGPERHRLAKGTRRPLFLKPPKRGKRKCTFLIGYQRKCGSKTENLPLWEDERGEDAEQEGLSLLAYVPLAVQGARDWVVEERPSLLPQEPDKHGKSLMGLLHCYCVTRPFSCSGPHHLKCHPLLISQI